MKTATVTDLAKWGPCWGMDDGRIAKIAGRRKRFSLKHVLATRGSEGLSDRDWLWLTAQFMCHIGLDREVRFFAADCAERALLREREAKREPDPRSWAAIEAARAYARQEIPLEDLRDAAAAAAAATAAAYANAYAAYAAYAAATAAAYAAAAATTAAYAANAAAAYANANAYAAYAERKWQYDHLAQIAGALC